ncbi:MAG TPA: Fur family transcriptional regulator [Patescibacteria group bacterium]|nr:Fur family transcriptional regulator [Patescibacteria group bacterium]
MDENSKTLLQKILKDNGYSMTQARQYVCELLWDKKPQSIHELAQKLDSKIDRASLYRTISLFERLGIVQRIYIGWKYKIELSDIFSHHHHHASCLQCGKIVAITEEDDIEKMINSLAAKHGFTAQNHLLEIRGYCHNCSAKQQAISKS